MNVSPMPPTVFWQDGGLCLIDQRRLPQELAILRLATVADAAEAIRDMAVRGAPAIGAAAAFAMALAAVAENPSEQAGSAELRGRVDRAAATLRAARPTAVNLAWAVERQLAVAERILAGGAAAGAVTIGLALPSQSPGSPASQASTVVPASHVSPSPGSPVSPASPTMGSDATLPERLAAALLAEARAIAEEDRAACRAMGRLGAALLPDPCRVVHHCNTGALATVDYGTALGVVRAAHEAGKRIEVLVDETRPRLQGARLTAWELARLGIPHRLIVDGAAAHFMAQGGIDAVLVGADRIAANGDTANKIGTYGLAVAARHHGLPFYVVAPLSTVDAEAPSGSAIPIEDRAAEELTEIEGRRVAPEGAPALNPAFDITPAALISAIVTEAGVVRPPFGPGLARLLAAPVSA